MTRRAFFAILLAGPSAWSRMLKPRPNYKAIELWQKSAFEWTVIPLKSLRPGTFKERR